MPVRFVLAATLFAQFTIAQADAGVQARAEVQAGAGFHALRIAGPAQAVQFDGALDEPVWTQATPFDNFYESLPLDRIPAGSRITKAEWVVRVSAVSPAEARLYAWRVLGDWGTGACYDYRSTKPEPVAWSAPGARGAAQDRAEHPSALGPCKANQDVTLNVTEDVELWHGGAAPNNGWMFTVEEEASLSLVPPAYTTRGSWKLRITYEPQQ